MRKNHTKNSPTTYTTEYVRIPSRPDLYKITAEPLKTIYINVCAGWWAHDERTIRNPDDPILRKIMKGGVA